MAMKRRHIGIFAAALAGIVLAGPAAMAQKRDTILITGSSTVNPFSRSVAERFTTEGGFKAPKIDSTGTVRGYNLFCQGAGSRYPDIQNASRRMNGLEFTLCTKNGVNEIMEIPIGHDGIVLATRKDAASFSVTRAQFWLAVAKEVPRNGAFVPNPYATWRQIDSALPDWPILVLGPPPTSGTRDSFTDLLMNAACQTFAEVRALTEAARRRAVCATVREDGKWVDSGEDDAKIVARIGSSPAGVLGVFGYSFLDEHADKLNGASLEGVAPTADNIAAGRYPLARPLFIYVKRPNFAFVAGLKEYLTLYVSPGAMGPGGFLIKRGLVPLDATQQQRLRDAVSAQVIMLRRPES